MYFHSAVLTNQFHLFPSKLRWSHDLLQEFTELGLISWHFCYFFVYERANNCCKVGLGETCMGISKAIFMQLFIAYSVVINDWAL